MMTASSTSIRDRHGVRRPRVVGILIAAVFLATLTYVSALTRVASGTAADPGAVAVSAGPTSPAQIAEPGNVVPLPPGSIAQIDRSIAIFTANLRAEPRDFISATTLASLYHARGRLSGDLADHQRAQEAARTAIENAPTERGARDLQAAILYTLHDFSGAFAAARDLVAADASDLGALATMADSELELGRLDDARTDLGRLAALASGPAVDIRLARLASVSGDLDEAKALARRAYASTQAQAAAGDAVDLGFYAYAAGEYARLAGVTSAARDGYVAALAVRDTDLGALVGLARLDAFEGHPQEAIAGLERAAAIQPQPETLALLGDIQASTGDTTAAARQFATVRFVRQLGEIQSSVFDRVLLRFELDHGGASDEVLAGARASLVTRPDWTGYDTVAWALYRLGRFDEASAEIDRATADGAADARVSFHAGAIALAQGDTDGGRAALQRALDLGPALDPVERAEAQRLLGH